MSAAADRGERLVTLARDAIAAPAEPWGPRTWEEPWLREPGASFVTLKIDDELRGCIGSIEPHRALGDDVIHNARAAAYRDPRFPPVSRAEVPLLQVEVSVLSSPQPLGARSEADALAQLRPGIDGLVFEYQGRRATFLPPVWEGLPDPEDFLGELRRKAGLPPHFWHPDVRLARYTVETYR